MSQGLNIENILSYLSSPSGIVDVVFAVLLVALLIFICVRFKFSKVSVCIISALLVALLIAALFDLKYTNYILIMYIVGTIFILCMAHIGSIRGVIFNLGKHKTLGKNRGFGKIVDHEALYKEIYEAVSDFSHKKIGALITFEKHDDLYNLTKNGTVVNAAVTHEMLMTIFYPGTRLHDGAVIIKDNLIYAASVYYTPTTKALTGKYGSRHRAAIGISQISDSITVVVSEETGRVSIAQAGELESVSLDNFIETLADRMKQGE